MKNVSIIERWHIDIRLVMPANDKHSSLLHEGVSEQHEKSFRIRHLITDNVNNFSTQAMLWCQKCWQNNKHSNLYPNDPKKKIFQIMAPVHK